MKRFILLFTTLLLSCSLFACTNKSTGMPNPNQSVSSLEELSEKVDASFMKADKASDETFTVIEGNPQIGEYAFTINGKTCVLRFSKDMDTDISGVYMDAKPLYPEEDEETHYVENDTYKATRWFTVDGQYIFFVKDDGEWDWSEYDRISSPFQNMKPKNWNSDIPFDDYLALTGMYINNDDCFASIKIKMDHVEVVSSSVMDEGTFIWSAQAILDGNKLVYEKESSELTIFDEQINDFKVIAHEDGPSGYIIIKDGSLDFSNVNNEQLKGKVFDPYFIP